ncbi:penicillin acylase family protein [Nisaea acidiphila]|uniref:Penicillin acylase family protein n=1 Tax=Nisaea acidiphila TaxID=1862145 RepID=A0A9J7AUA1_9PROT|nr:penicillin acylase family protein [Nisaea acidiphila]UUX50402.1 penicillin acylase family protein [Nisaea acidiphila]
MKSWVKRLAVGFVFAILGLNFAAAGLLIWLGGSLPQIEGEKRLPGLSESVEIRRDDAGIPVIRAASMADATFALGFVHAQDRLWQMESMRRIGAGRLAEIVGTLSESLGEEILPIDRFTRGLGFYRRAEAAYERASPELKAALKHYANGVNAYLATREGPLPPEFVALFHEPEPWTPADSLVWQQLMAFQLGTNWADELVRLRMAEAGLTAAQIDFLYREADGGASRPIEIKQGRIAPHLLDQAVRFAASMPPQLAPQGASNAWALSGSRTESGKPLLANDPHLRLTNPNLWYLARIETPEGVRVGGTVPGVPFLVLGHNGKIAWGFTTPNADIQDLFIEQIDPSDPARYLAPGGSRAFETREELFLVGSRERRETFRSTRHGPVLSDITGRAESIDASAVLAIAAPSFATDDASPEAFFRLSGASSVPDAIDLLRDFSSPAQNITLADRDGNIALLFAGRVPERVAADGFLPAEGTQESGDWTGWVERDRLPLQLNPESGAVLQANNRLAGSDPDLSLGREFEAPFRAQRIRAAIEDMGDKATLNMQTGLQMDTLSVEVSGMLDLLLPRLRAEALTDGARAAVGTLRAWDGRIQRDRAAPLIYTLWTSLLHRRIFGDELGHLIKEYRRVRPHMFEAVIREAPEWCDDIRSDAVEPCETAIRESLEEAIARLTAKYGADQTGWLWGRAHEVEFRHLLWSRVPVLRDLLNASPVTDGGDYTVNRGSPSVRISDGDFSFPHVHGAGIRAVYDLSDLDASLFSTSLGQSGNPFSEHYQDLAIAWADGSYRTVGSGPAPGTRTLILRPE